MRRRRPTSPPSAPAQVLELRTLLSISDLAASVSAPDQQGLAAVELNWRVPADVSHGDYEVWTDQRFTSGQRNSKLYYRSSVERPSTSHVSYRLENHLGPGQYNVWVRGVVNGNLTAWAATSFEIASNVAEEVPARPEITAFREGQGAAGQSNSESAIGWKTNSTWHDVWLGRRSEDGRWLHHASLRNVPGASISLRELAIAAGVTARSAHGDVVSRSQLAQLVSGDYQFFVRGINGAVDAQGHWTGRGPWSRGYEFRFDRLEGPAAVPVNLRVTQETNFEVRWDPVAGAESYLLSLWKGPDYAAHRPVNIPVHGTRYRHGDTSTLTTTSLSIQPGDEVFVRVRAVGSEGMLEGLRPGNFASAIIRLPDTLEDTEVGIPKIQGPENTTSHAAPVLRWTHAAHADSYDVWFSSRDIGRRLFLASGVTSNVLHLTPEILATVSHPPQSDSLQLDSSGLVDGHYRFWVRARNTDYHVTGSWTRGFDFEISSAQITEFSAAASEPQRQPQVSPNLILPYSSNGESHLLVTNGRGESFGASVLARFHATEDDLTRPVHSPQGRPQLTYPDLPVGSNVTDMAFIDERYLLVLSRGSNDLHLVDVALWQVISRLDLATGAAGEALDVMDLEVLSNGQIFVVANRSNRLRVIEVSADRQLREIHVPDSTTTQQGFPLPRGRAVQVSAAERADGRYAVFLATPQTHGVVTAIYDPQQLTLTPATAPNGQALPVISRSQFSSPFLGGTLFRTSLSEAPAFYLSTDRNGFLTWVNITSYEYGFVDLAEFIVDASRDPLSADYRNPDDSHIDPIRLLQIDDAHIAVTNNRTSSVILKLAVDGTTLQVQSGTATRTGYSAAFSGGDKPRLYSTAGGGPDLPIAPNNIVMTQLTYDAQHQQWETGPVTGFVLADPVIRAGVDERGVSLQYFAGRRVLLTDEANAPSLQPQTYTLHSADGRRYEDRGGSAEVLSTSSGQRYLATHLVLNSQTDSEEHFLGIVDITIPTHEKLQAAYPLPPQFHWHSVDFTEERAALLDRLGGRLLTVTNWQTPAAASIETTVFADRLPTTFGQTRSGRVRRLEDGTNVVLHDTVPDKVFTVFPPDRLHDNSAVPHVHANHAGQWIYDMHVLDQQRIIAVTWDAKLLILNVRTGVFETIRHLDRHAFAALDLFGVLETDYRQGRLSVSSPGAGVVATFQVRPYDTGVGFDVQLTSVVRAPDVVSTLLTDHHWIVESTRVRRLP